MSAKTWVELISAFLEWLTGSLFEDLRAQAEAVQKIEADTAPKILRAQTIADTSKAEADLAAAKAEAERQVDAMTPTELAAALAKATEDD